MNGRFLLATGLAAPLVLGLAVFLAGSQFPDYSHVSQFISELGATAAPTRTLLNYGGLIPAGALTVAFGLAMYRRFRPGMGLAVSATLVVVAGLSRLIAGIFPCDPGCSMVAMSRSAQIHSMAGLSAFVSAILATFCFAFGVRAKRKQLFRLSLVLGAGALLALVVGFLQGRDYPFVGLLQRLHLAFFYSWVVIVAVAGAGRVASHSVVADS